MQTNARNLFTHVLRGALFGSAAWSAYAVSEFVFTSVAYRLTRPYATFTAWHWRLTALVAAGYLVCGIVAGAVTGLAAGLRRRRAASADVLESAAAVVLTLALMANLAAGGSASAGGASVGEVVQIAAGVLFLVLLGLEMRSEAWRGRVGWVTSPWVVSATWLGIGLAFSVLRMRLGSQLGKRLDLAAAGLFGAIALCLLAALFAGQRLGRRRIGMCVGSWIAATLLVASSLVLGEDLSSVAQAASVPAPAAEGARPNLVLMVMDTVRADHLSLYGYARRTTPHLEELARDAVVYGNAFSASDITLTSHASLFTGMYPGWHGAYSQPPQAVYGREISPRYPTLAELLRQHGYDTLGVAANLYLRADFGLERGFDTFRIPRPVPLLPDEERYTLRGRLRRALSLVSDTAQFDRLFTYGEDVDRELFAALERRAHPSAPFFAFVNYMDAHFPYVPPAPYDRLFPGKRPGVTGEDLGVEIGTISKGLGQPPGYRPHCESQYDGGIAYMDAQIGKVVEWLKRHNEYERTMIVVTSDHGESFGERNRVGHANSPYQNLLHTALLIKYPGSASRGREARPVSLIDVAPTALAAMGIAAPAAMQGAALNDGAPAPRRIFAETFQNPVSHSPDCPEGCVTRVAVEWPLKLVDNLTNGRQELFDLARDPDEGHNLFAVQRENAASIAADLGEWAKALPAQRTGGKRVDSGIESTLRGNGYVAR